MSSETNWRRLFRPRWLLSGIVTAVLILVVVSIQAFLAVSDPVGEGILVVEAWVPAKTLAESARIFKSRHYRCFLVVGGPVPRGVGHSDQFRTYDELATNRLEKLGVNIQELVQISVPAVAVGRRTVTSATAVARWVTNSGISVCCVDVFTAGVHARKSWILYRHALGDGYRVGIIAGTPASYDPAFWFLSRRGIWDVGRNLAGYVYSKLLILCNENLSPQRPLMSRSFTETPGTESPPYCLLCAFRRPLEYDPGLRFRPSGVHATLPSGVGFL